MESRAGKELVAHRQEDLPNAFKLTLNVRTGTAPRRLGPRTLRTEGPERSTRQSRPNPIDTHASDGFNPPPPPSPLVPRNIIQRERQLLCGWLYTTRTTLTTKAPPLRLTHVTPPKKLSVRHHRGPLNRSSNLSCASPHPREGSNVPRTLRGAIAILSKRRPLQRCNGGQLLTIV